MSTRSQTPIERVPLGWDAPPQARAAEWLADRFGADMDGVLVAQPGARGGRLLREHLARKLGAGWRPPQFVTAGRLSDALLGLEGRGATRTVRTLAWVAALRGADQNELRRIVARPPKPDEHAAWLRLAEEVRGLFGEVAAEGIGFDAVARGEGLPSEAAGELARWKALASAQARMAEALTAEGLQDPHLARLAAIESEHVEVPRAIVLIGVVESTGLLRRALDLCDCPKTALLFAPAELEACFDDHGTLTPARWIERGTSIGMDDWRVVEGPDDQAAAAIDAIAGWDARFPAEQITVGLGDAEVAPYLKRRLAAVGVRARDAAGVPISRSGPARLLDAVADYLDGRRYSAYAALVRHPDLEARLRADHPDLEAVSLLDEYQPEHLPFAGNGEWYGDHASELTALAKSVHTLLGELDTPVVRPLSGWASATRELLSRIYGDRLLRDDVEADRSLSGSLSQIGRALDEIDGLPSSLELSGGPSVTLSLLSKMISGASLPAAATVEGAPTIELLGWLELALDDAPAVVITGFNDGKIPESVRGDAFLPDSLRRSLGLIDDDRRLARDLYASELLVHSRAECVFLTGRKSLAGDPMLPSRILFHCSDDRLLDRVTRFLDGTGRHETPVEPERATRELPRMPEEQSVERISVTGFKAYLSSPYAFYLQRVLKLESGDDRARELDPMGFGNLVHDALESWGLDQIAREQADAERIAKDMIGRLRMLARTRFGDEPLPAVALQIEQIAWRLEHFAERQAQWFAQGWRVREVEWSPEGRAVPFDVDGVDLQLSGKIDRIDQNIETNEFALIDYKTGETTKSALRAHRKQDGTWTDLQLPLYVHLAASVLGGAVPTVGYATLGRDESSIAFDMLTDFAPKKKEPESMRESLESAYEAAREVVRRVRNGEFFTLGSWAPREPIWNALGGSGLVVSAAAEAEEEGQ
jgi:ATP-dependent helicase/nuclease subunit B